jgi:hypothetical protein
MAIVQPAVRGLICISLADFLMNLPCILTTYREVGGVPICLVRLRQLAAMRSVGTGKQNGADGVLRLRTAFFLLYSMRGDDDQADGAWVSLGATSPRAFCTMAHVFLWPKFHWYHPPDCRHCTRKGVIFGLKSNSGLRPR